MSDARDAASPSSPATCRIYEHDGGRHCYTHGTDWNAGDVPPVSCADAPRAAAPSLSEEERATLRWLAEDQENDAADGSGFTTADERAGASRAATLLRRLAGPDTPPHEPISAAPTPEGTNG